MKWIAIIWLSIVVSVLAITIDQLEQRIIILEKEIKEVDPHQQAKHTTP